MKKFYISALVMLMSMMTSLTSNSFAQQVSNADFEDWSGAAFDGKAQPKGWNASNVTQFGFKFNFAHKETGRSGYCMMVQDQEVGAAGITEVSPGYFALGTPWVYVPSLTRVGEATAGTKGGINWTYRPDTLSVWIKRTGDNTDKEDFYLLYYSWSGTARATKYHGKNGGCTSIENIDEESDIRQALNPNGCGTEEKATQIAEGMWREKKTYGNWTNIRVPIYYFNNTVPEKMNILFSASNYPNGGSTTGLYAGNSLYVDDVEMVYSSKIQKLFINGIEWKGFDPNSTDVQNYALGESATAIPSIEAKRGAGTLTNAKGVSANFPGRTLSGSEITVVNGDLDKKPTTITVKSEDGKSTTVYKIQFQKAASSNTKLAGISYTVGTKAEAISDFSPAKYNYTVDLPFGTKSAPVLSADKQEDGQTVAITQASSPTGSAKIVVTAPNKQATATYNITFRVAALSDNTLKDIKVNGTSLAGFNPSQAVYKVSLPTSTKSLTVEPVSAYDKGLQTIVVTPNPLPSGDAINGATVQISVTTPGNSVAKVYKLNIKLEASSYTYLKSLSVSGDQIQKVSPAQDGNEQAIAFTPDNMTYYVTLKMGTTALPKITYEQGDEYQKVEVALLADGVLDGTVRVTVTAGNGDQSVYKIVFLTEKSENSALKGITIGGTPLEDFAPDVTTYSYTLPEGTTELPEIVAIPADEFQTITVTTGGVSGKTRITVTAGNGSTTIYQITFSVKTFNDNTLKSLAVEGFDINFDPEQTDYYINLPKGTTALPQVTYELQSTEFQTVRETKLAGLNGDYKITVRPQSGASRTYIIHFSLNKSNNTALKAIYLDGEALAGFHADTLHYVDSLPEGVSRIPNVTFDKAEGNQRVLSVLEGTTQIITVTAETGDTREYRIDFIVRISANAFLDMIYLDGDSLEGFDSETLKYEVELKGDRCPAITVDKAAGQQVTITAPYAAGVAQIKVQPGVGAANLYLITFKVQTAPVTVQLSNILVNGVGITGFSPAKTEYTLTYQGERPVIKGTASEEKKVSDALWRSNVAWLYVTDAEGNQGSYSVTCTRQPMTVNTLKAIYADGVALADFDPAKTDYVYELEPGSAFPEITYTAENSAQVVFFGQTAEGVWTIKVAGENGVFSTYTVRYTVKKRSDATLADLQVEGHDIDFAPAKTDYALTIDEGAVLPAIRLTPREGQRIMSYSDDADHQRVLVTAEDGTEKTYTVAYSRKQSTNALLASILLDGKKLEGFEPDRFDYAITLPKSAEAVPNVFPVAQLNNQTITTFYSGINGTTKIHVVAQDGTTSADYTIAFSVAISTNTKLGSLIINGDAKNVDETEYNFVLLYGTTLPYTVAFTKAEEAQLIDYTEAPIDDVTRITVKAENGDTRTYTIRYTVAQPEGANTVANITYKYVTKSNETVNGELVPVKGENIINLPYGAKSFDVTGVTKSYPEQSVIFYNGGIRRGAKIIASANKDNEPDAVYTVIPKILPDTVGKLKELYYIKAGETIPVPHFNPDVYSYMINVKEQPTKATFVAVPYGTIMPQVGDPTTSKAKKSKQITIRVGTGTPYSVCWFYEEDKDPFDFSNDWVVTKYNGATKPSSAWKVYTDFTDGNPDLEFVGYPIPFYAGKEVSRYGTNGVLLSTMRQGAIRCSVPGMMTLGKLNADFAKGNLASCAATSSVDTAKFIEKGGGKYDTLMIGTQFRNTPEQLEFSYSVLNADDIDNWNIWIMLGDSSKNKDYKWMKETYSYSDAEKTGKKIIPLVFPKNPVNMINATLNSCHTENCNDMGALNDKQVANLVLQDMHLAYNSELTAAKVDGKDAAMSGNVFSINVDANYVGVPVLSFTGAVHDQTRTIEWLNGGEWKDSLLTALVVNYGENSIDSTHYYVVLKRDAVTSLDYTVDFGTYPTKALTEDTTLVTLPYGVTAIPDINITPGSIHQQFTVEKSGNAVTITVQAENGDTKTHVYLFSDQRSNKATVELFEALDANEDDIKMFVSEDDEISIYTATAARIPTLAYTKHDGVVGQTFETVYTADSAWLVVTAADGSTKHTYFVRRKEPVVTTDAVLKDFSIYGGDDLALGGSTKTLTAARPTNAVLFSRKFNTDSVVFLIDETKMQWTAYGTGTVTNTYTLTYPTAVSEKATLSALRINGVDFSEFNENITEYEIVSDSAIWLATVPSESEQTLQTTAQIQGDTTIYSTVVTAEDAVHKQTYKVVVRRSLSSISTLEAISYGGKRIEGFRPDSTDYIIIIPAQAYKTETPQIGSIAYEAGHEGQTIEMTPSLVLGEPTEIIVTAEDGSKTTYTVTVNAEPSHCAELAGIMIDGKVIDQFEAGRHFYSVSQSAVATSVEVIANDQYQTIKPDTVVVKLNEHYRYGFTVTAEDGFTVEKYEVEVYVENKSNDAQLANITLDGKNFVDFERALNSDLTFDPGNNLYTINLPAGTTILPEVNAQLKMDGQAVDISRNGDVIVLKVTAVDEKTTNSYTLRFVIPQSKNANLSMLFLDGDSLPGFEPNTYFYQIELPIGTHELPEVVAQKAEVVQTIVSNITDTAKLQTVITVQAEDPSTRVSTYTVVFRFTQSDADTLAVIYADGDSLPGFMPKQLYYTFALPVGTPAFPTLDYELADEWQTVTMDTVEASPSTLIRQLNVVSESGKKNTYTVSYTILKSDIDTLQMIIVDQKQLPNFRADVTEYYYTLTASQASELDGALPAVEVIAGDEYQTVLISQAQDSLSGKSLGYKSLVTVTAATGVTRTYIIHYPVELSSEATLNMIMLGGKPLSNYDAERFNYKTEIVMDAAIPVVSVVKKEEAQTYEIRVIEDTVLVEVVAEDLVTQQTYTLIFERLLSSNALVRDIVLRDSAGTAYPSGVFAFRPETFTYPEINLPYVADTALTALLPSIEVVFSDSLQTMDTTLHTLPNGDIQIDITVTAPNGEDQAVYTLLFHFVKPSDALLKAIMIGEELLPDFAPKTTEYTFVHPYGTPEEHFLTLDSISYELSDEHATDSASIDDEHTIFITVLAQDGTTEMTYIIRQTVGKDSNNKLAWITLNGDTISGFNPEVTFYTYYLFEGASVPEVLAEAMSENAEVSIREVSAGDTCVITCIAADESVNRYYIHFAISAINDGLNPSENDVLVKRIPGTNKIMIGTLRKGVNFAMYDENGHCITFQGVPVADPNDAEVYKDSDNKDVLNNISDPENSLVIEVNTAQPYFYTFYDSSAGKVKTGKIMLLQ